ncbi:MAG: hypothetical protein AAFU57_13740, partial [Bacteroidota bacterium]
MTINRYLFFDEPNCQLNGPKRQTAKDDVSHFGLIMEYRELFYQLEKPIFQKTSFELLIRTGQYEESEWCFIYVHSGQIYLNSDKEKAIIRKGEGVFINNWGLINEWQVDLVETPNEIIVIHFFVEVLQFIFKNKPSYFLKVNKSQNFVPLKIIKPNDFLRGFMQGLSIYFEVPELLDVHMIKIKLYE